MLNTFFFGGVHCSTIVPLLSLVSTLWCDTTTGRRIVLYYCSSQLKAKSVSFHSFGSYSETRREMGDSPRTIRFGVIGCADIARKVSRAIALSPSASLYAVGSRYLYKARGFAAANGFPDDAKVYGSYEAVLDDPDVDAVYVPLPTSMHVRWASLAARKGKHVLLEKPVALTAAEFDEIAHACESSGVQLMDGTMWMHNPRTASMKDFLSDAHRFGHLKSVCMHSFALMSFSFASIDYLCFCFLFVLYLLCFALLVVIR